MKLYDFLKECGLFANELRSRLKNDQILVNGEPQKGDHDIGNITESFDQGFFMEELYKIPNYDKWSNQLIFIGISNLMSEESNIKNELTDFLKDYKMIQTSKGESIFVKISESLSDQIVFHRESGHCTIKVEQVEKVDQTELVNKVRSDYDKLSKQLLNPGFINNAPKFKIDSVRTRLENLKIKLREININEIIEEDSEK